MAASKKKKKKTTRVKLSEAQLKSLEKAFGKAFAKRAKSLKVTMIEGYGLAELVTN